MLEKPSPYDPDIVNDLVSKWQRDQDERARDELVRRFMPLIRSAARHWGSRYKVHPDDADQESAIGFLKAIDKFEPAMGSLAHYAQLLARARIGRARHGELQLSVPTSALNDASKAARAAFALHRRLGRGPSLEEIAAEVGLSVKRTGTALAARSIPTLVIGIDTPLGGEDFTVGDTLEADPAERPDVIVEEAGAAACARAAIEAVLASFVPRHQQAMRLRLWDGLTLEEVGDRMGVGKERVRQIESKALPRLREALFDNPAVLGLLGREPEPVEVGDDTGKLLNVREVETRTGLDRKAITEMTGRGAFPRSIAIAVTAFGASRPWSDGWSHKRNAGSGSLGAWASSEPRSTWPP